MNVLNIHLPNIFIRIKDFLPRAYQCTCGTGIQQGNKRKDHIVAMKGQFLYIFMHKMISLGLAGD